MTWIDYTIIAAYLIGLLGVGWFFRHQHNRQEYFLGGRSLPWPALTLSIMATQLSAVSFISAPAFVGLREGGGMIWLSYELALPLAMGILLWRLMPSLHKAGVVSIYDYLQQRFNVSTRLLISLVFQISRSFATAIMIYAISLILQGTLGLQQWHSIAIIGVITLIYSAMGGMKAVVYGDALQMILILAGALTCLWVAVDLLGGFGAMISLVEPQRLNAMNPSGWGLEGNDFGLIPMLFGGMVLYASYYGCDQSEAQRSLSGASLTDMRKMLLSVAVLRFPITLIYCLAGLAVGALVMSSPELRAQIPADEPDWMMPIFIINHLPSGIIGILVVAIMAAAMSSLSSAINSLSAVSVEDYCRLTGQQVEDSRYLNMARIAGVFWGGITLVLSFYAGDIAPTIIEAINKIGSVFYGPVLAVFLLGIHSKHVTARDANVALCLGVAANVALWLSQSTIFWFWWNLIGFSIALIVGLLLAHFGHKHVHTDKLPSVRLLSNRDALILILFSAGLVLICWQFPSLVSLL